MNLPIWALTFHSIKQANGEWIADAPEGQVKIRMTGRNKFGVLDHYVKVLSLPNTNEIFVPIRVISNDEGCEVLLTLFQTAVDMPDKKFIENMKLMEQDLKNLKNLLEKKR